MPKAEIKTEETDPLAHIKWAAWGVINIEKLERMQRRNYIKRARSEADSIGWELSCGGSTRSPHYRLASKEGSHIHSKVGDGAFASVCSALLTFLETSKA